MTDKAKDDTDKAKDDAKANTAPRVVLQRAGESQDPAVHQLMADLWTARQNGDEKAAETAVARLEALGFTDA